MSDTVEPPGDDDVEVTHDTEAAVTPRPKRQRPVAPRIHRWLVVLVACVVLAAVVVTLVVTEDSTPTHPPVLPIAARQWRTKVLTDDLRGDYLATYRVNGLSWPFPLAAPHYSITVALAGLRDGNILTGTWSYVINAGHGAALQWIERGSHYQDCVRTSAAQPWTCGEGTYQQSIGFSYLTSPLVPEEVDSAITTIVNRSTLLVESPSHVRVSTERSAQFGRLSCVTTRTSNQKDHGSGPVVSSRATWCIDQRGVLVSQRTSSGSGDDEWTTVRLVSLASHIPAKAFRPYATPSPTAPLPGL